MRLRIPAPDRTIIRRLTRALSRRALFRRLTSGFPLLFMSRSPAQPAPAPVTLDQFIALSIRLTGHSRLDRPAAQSFLSAILASPPNRELLSELSRGLASTPRHAALERAIIEAWYTGVHQFSSKPQLVTHRHALVWRALGVAAPGTCAGPLGFWSSPLVRPK